jgi:hypothetical protein
VISVIFSVVDGLVPGETTFDGTWSQMLLSYDLI